MRIKMFQKYEAYINIIYAIVNKIQTGMSASLYFYLLIVHTYWLHGLFTENKLTQKSYMFLYVS